MTSTRNSVGANAILRSIWMAACWHGPDASRHCGLNWNADGAQWFNQTLAVGEASVWECCIRPQTVNGHGRVSRAYFGSRAAYAGAARFRCSTQALGGRANVRMADALPASGARLRKAH